MYKIRIRSLFVIILVINQGFIAAQSSLPENDAFKVISYDARIEPEILKKQISGMVAITLVSDVEGLSRLAFQKGDLTIDSVFMDGHSISFKSDSQEVVLLLPEKHLVGTQKNILIVYHGTPVSGIKFLPESGLVYTVFSTSHWMPCLDAPSAKSTFRLRLILPDSLKCVANGRLVTTTKQPNGKRIFEWLQDSPVPTYTFGFAAGKFNELWDSAGAVKFRYLSSSYDGNSMQRIFKETRSILRFFEDYSGIKYSDQVYSQVLVPGGVAQEMSSFAVIGEGYAADVLKEDADIGIFIHEMAHQWWGNMVTCIDWRHFWLNEGMATWMVAKYKAVRFGKAASDTELTDIKAGYENVLKAGKDKPLVFPDWNHPSREDRIIVYDKGAYVFQLLEEEMGETDFREGIRLFTRRFFGKSVTSTDLQRAMEQAGRKNLDSFFKKWVYGPAK
jgi:aminopeptidase N